MIKTAKFVFITVFTVSSIIISALLMNKPRKVYAYSVKQDDIPVTPTPSYCASQEEILGVYSEVLKNAKESVKNIESTSKATIENIQITTERILWVGGVVFGILTLEGLGSVWLIQKAKQNSIEARRDATIAIKDADKASKDLDELCHIYDNLKEKTEVYESKVERLNGIFEDLEWFTNLMLVHEIKNNAIRLANEKESHDALRSIKAQLEQAAVTQPNPAARLEIVRSFQAFFITNPRILPEIKNEIREILNNLIASETENIIKIEAEKLLEKLC